MADSSKELVKCAYFLAGLVILLSSPLYLDQFLRSDKIINSKVTEIYEREEKVGKYNWVRKRVASTKRDGQIEIEVPIHINVDDTIIYKKNCGPLGIVPTVYKFYK